MTVGNISSYNGTWVNGVQVLTYENTNWDCVLIHPSVQAFNHCDSYIRGTRVPIWNPTNIGDPTETLSEIADLIIRLFRVRVSYLSPSFESKDLEGKALWNGRWDGYCRERFFEFRCQQLFPMCGPTTSGWHWNAGPQVPCQSACDQVNDCCDGFLTFAPPCEMAPNSSCFGLSDPAGCPNTTTTHTTTTQAATTTTPSPTPSVNSAPTSKPWFKTALLVSLISSTLLTPLFAAGSLR